MRKVIGKAGATKAVTVGRALVTIAVLSLGFALGYTTRPATVAAQQAPCEEERFYNADYNGDGKFFGSATDAIGLLSWCFLGESPPEVCFAPKITELSECRSELEQAQISLARAQEDLAECRKGNAIGVTATGQLNVCSDANGNEIPCDNEMCPGQDGVYQNGCAFAGRLVDNSDGTVTDTCTGLMWQQATGNNEMSLSWCEPLATARTSSSPATTTGDSRTFRSFTALSITVDSIQTSIRFSAR